MQKTFSIDSQSVAKALESAAQNYEKGEDIPHAIADRLLERLDFIRLNPFRVVDFGARTGYTTKGLLKHYKMADIISLDFSLSLLNRGKNNFRKKKPLTMLVAEYTLLPFVDHSIDLIFSNLVFQWSLSLPKTLQECWRILRPGGLLLFSTVGPDTLKELRTSFSDKKRHVHSFYDMHDIGDMLTHLGFVHAVMDMECLTVRYSSVLQLMADLKAIGAHNAAQDRARGLMGRHQWKRMLETYEQWRYESHVPVTIEVIYSHAFRSENMFRTDKEQGVLIPVNHIKKRLKSKN